MADDVFEMGFDDTAIDAAIDAKIDAARQELGPAADADATAGEPEGRERDAQGRFVPAGTTPDVEPAGAEEAAEAEEQAGFLGGRFSTVESLEQAVLERERMIGRLGDELGQLRQTVEQVAQTQQQTQAQPQYDADALEEWLDQNQPYLPAIAQQAHDRGDHALFRAAVTKWQELDPYGAIDYLTDMKVARAVQATAAPLLQAGRQTAAQAAVAALSSRYADFGQVLEAATADDIPRPLADLVRGAATQQAQEEALDALYHVLRSKTAGPSGPVAKAVKEAEKAAAEEGKREKIAATVASATSSPSRDDGKTIQQRLMDEMLEHDRPFDGAWSRAD